MHPNIVLIVIIVLIVTVVTIFIIISLKKKLAGCQVIAVRLRLNKERSLLVRTQKKGQQVQQKKNVLRKNSN